VTGHELELVKEARIAGAGHGHRQRPPHAPQGQDQLLLSQIAGDQLEDWAPKVKEITGKVRRTYGYFNNHFNANAVKNAVEMLELLGQATPEQRIVHDKITTYREEAARPRGVQSLDAFSISDEDLGVADHLLHFTDPGRIGRGEKISNYAAGVEVTF